MREVLGTQIALDAAHRRAPRAPSARPASSSPTATSICSKPIRARFDKRTFADGSRDPQALLPCNRARRIVAGEEAAPAELDQRRPISRCCPDSRQIANRFIDRVRAAADKSPVHAATSPIDDSSASASFVAIGCHRERLGEIRATLGEMRMQVPEPVRDRRRRERSARAHWCAANRAPREDCRDRLRGGRARPFRLRPHRARIGDELLEVRRMPIADIVREHDLPELLDRVSADRLEHAEALALPPDEALVDERRDDVERRIEDRLGRVDRELACEYAELREQLPLRGVEQVVTPRQRIADRLLAHRDDRARRPPAVSGVAASASPSRRVKSGSSGRPRARWPAAIHRDGGRSWQSRARSRGQREAGLHGPARDRRTERPTRTARASRRRRHVRATPAMASGGTG